jgi:hypothetical protein
MITRSTSIFKDPNVAKHLSLLHDKMLLIILRSPVITWPIGLYMNGGTNTGAIRRLKFEIVNIEITQHMFVIKSF